LSPFADALAIVVAVVLVVTDVAFLPTLNTIAPSVKLVIGVVVMVDTAPSSFFANVTRLEWLMVGSWG
jgi:hypothetical protein